MPDKMKRRLLFPLCLSLVFGSACAQTVDVSLVSLIATPKEFHGKSVRVIGYVRLEFEGDSIYLRKEDSQRRIAKNGLWLDVDVPAAQKAGVNNRYAIVEGIFSMEEKGHFGMWSGSIKSVTRLDPWPAR